MRKILISACLLGQHVRYDGGHNLSAHPLIIKWNKNNQLIPICPEVVGGLPIPRPPCRVQGCGDGHAVLAGQASVFSDQGVDSTEAFLNGARKALALAQQHEVALAILKSKSPSCGNEKIYDGDFETKHLIDGQGVAAALLTEHNYKVFNENQIDAAGAYLESI